MSTVHALVSGTCVINNFSIRIDVLQQNFPQSGQPVPTNNTNKTPTSHKPNNDRCIKTLFKQLSPGCEDSVDGASSCLGPLEELFMSGVKKVLQKNPLTKALDETTLKNNGIPINKVIAAEMENVMRTEEGKAATYASCDVIGDVKDNLVRISVKLNFYNTENVVFKQVNVETVKALAMDGSKIIFNDSNHDRNSQNMTDA